MCYVCKKVHVDNDMMDEGLFVAFANTLDASEQCTTGDVSVQPEPDITHSQMWLLEEHKIGRCIYHNMKKYATLCIVCHVVNG